MIYPNLRHLEIFLALCSSGSVSGTARQMNLTQPAVSKAIAHLQETTQVRLFDRQRNRLQLTADGFRLRDETERLLNQVALFGSEVEALQQARRGQVSVAAIPSLGIGAVADAVGDFNISHRGAHIRFVIEMSRRVIELVAQNRADVGFIHGNSGRPEIHEIFAGETEVHCLMRRDHPLAGKHRIYPEDLDTHPLIFFDPDSPPSTLIRESFARAGVQPVIRTEINASVLSPRIVREGAVAFVDPLSTRPEPHLVLRPFVPRTALPIFILTQAGKTPSLLLSAFCESARHAIFRAITPGRAGEGVP